MHTHKGPKRATAAPSRAFGLISLLALAVIALAAITGWSAASAASALGREPDGSSLTATTLTGTTTTDTATTTTATTTTGTTTDTATTTGTDTTTTATGTGTSTATTSTGTVTDTTTTDETDTSDPTAGNGPGAVISAPGLTTSDTTPTVTSPYSSTTPATTTATTTTPTRTTTTRTGGTATTPHKKKHKTTTRTTPTRTVTITVTTPAPTTTTTSASDPVDADTSAATSAAVADPLSSDLGVDSATELALSSASASVASDTPPAKLIPVYKAAASVYGVPWQVLAAINAVESDYGTDEGTSSAGAIGWMQFEPATFKKYEIPTGTSRRASPYNDVDAIFAAGHLLWSNGAGTNLRKAIYAYNHADWYVDEVTFLASQIVGARTPKSANAKEKITSMTDAAKVLAGTPYVWGGGHSGWSDDAGYDCSGFVSAVLHAAGYLTEPQTTQTLPAAADIESGAGKYVTIFDRTDAGSGDDHVIIDIDGQWWESGGGSADGGAGDVHRIADVSPTYLATFNTELHPKGL